MEVTGGRVHVITWGSVGFVIQILLLTSRFFRPLEPQKPNVLGCLTPRNQVFGRMCLGLGMWLLFGAW
tara:strand:+ start:13464 stop:13667 length:204 start_codon:yes stop_codon:yes gene_type:complete